MRSILKTPLAVLAATTMLSGAAFADANSLSGTLPPELPTPLTALYALLLAHTLVPMLRATHHIDSCDEQKGNQQQPVGHTASLSEFAAADLLVRSSHGKCASWYTH